MEGNLEAARGAYRIRNGDISPQAIVDLRKKYKLSQKALAKILDIGKLTINSYERRALPSGAHNILLRLANEPDNMKMLFEANRNKLSRLQQEKADDALSLLKQSPFRYEPGDCQDELTVVRKKQ